MPDVVIHAEALSSFAEAILAALNGPSARRAW
jgi:hypothetical protein